MSLLSRSPEPGEEDEIQSHLIAELGIPRERLALEKAVFHAKRTVDEIIRVPKLMKCTE